MTTRTHLGLMAVTPAVAMLVVPAAATSSAAERASLWRVFPGARVDEGRPLLGVAWAALEHFRYGGASPLVYAFVRVAR